MKVLIIDNNVIFAEMVRMYLAEEDFTVQTASTARDGLRTFHSFVPDVVLLDLSLPDVDEITLCKTLRQQTQTPIIVVSINSRASEIIKAFTAGADDFLTKPFSMQELKARIMIAIRKSIQPPSTENSPEIPADEHFLQLQLDPVRRYISVNGDMVETTFSEFELLKVFYEHPYRVFTRDELITIIRGINYHVNDRSIDVHITNLRRKIEIDPKKPKYIQTVWGLGYRFAKP
ncbi:response regulator transcription factor [Paenibacillus sp. V4I7]|uniref:response regulator transcription factor n=1 Tax=Paenibacillus sp. V4I7 TaxID=3042307 RepID=UPI0027831BF1|nr:response regulator transcription factor [Paenibacillus sp. V4I7]MDQ0903475.1 DNA-binding response OmpR family regulator [Paenibacillus sp. V4I7]